MRGLSPHMGSRAYFADGCTAGVYDHTQYAALQLLGKVMSYTVDLSGVGCGCNVAFYLTSMRQNAQPSECSDYYCDANSVCGVACPEIDIQEANQFAWHSTLHSAQDGSGAAAGYGGGGVGWNGPRDWSAAQYSPGSRCINTSAPFEVSVAFPTNAQGALESMQVTLSQQGHSCPVSVTLGSYSGMGELSKALALGMTPVLSYWKSDDMRWMDGAGGDGQGPCRADTPCVDSAKMHSFAIRDLKSQGQAQPDTVITDAGDDGQDEAPVEVVPSGSVVAEHGRLRVQGNQIVGKTGSPVRLRGMSLFWSQWKSQYWNRDIVDWLKFDFHATLVRAPMGVEMGGYLENPATERKHIETVVRACIRAGIYVIVDWHDHHASSHVEQSKSFFKYMSRKYGHYENVMFEIWNEPLQVDWATEIKVYHDAIVPVIREHSENLVICGTRDWSQGVDEAAMNRVVGENVAYTIHFYAASHGQLLRDRVSAALNRGVAVFATEWGTCEASGDGALNLGEAEAWLDFLRQNHISDANWAVSDKDEACSALESGASGSGGWEPAHLSKSGIFVRTSLRASLPSLPTITTTTVTTTSSYPALAAFPWALIACVSALVAVASSGTAVYCAVLRKRSAKEEDSVRALPNSNSSHSLKPTLSSPSLKQVASSQSIKSISSTCALCGDEDILNNRPRRSLSRIFVDT